MGVLNVTPDSFSGDGLLSSGAAGGWVERCVDQALRMEAAGADIIDVGGESTRPPSRYEGAKPVDEAEELRRIIPVIDALQSKLSVPISIDTRKANVARAAVEAGAATINDVSMLSDPNMAKTAAELGVPLAIGHIRSRAIYKDVTTEVGSPIFNLPSNRRPMPESRGTNFSSTRASVSARGPDTAWKS